MNAIKFVPTEEVKEKRTKGQRYAKYAEALLLHLDDIKKGIIESPEKRVVVKTKDLKELMGMAHKSDKSVYWGTKFVMWTEGIAVGTATHIDGSPLLVFREPKEGEKLPESMAKYSTEEEEEAGIE